MRYMLYLVIVSVLLVPGWATAQFADCDSAHNNGSNIARTAVSSAFNQMACVENALGATEDALAMVLVRHRHRPAPAHCSKHAGSLAITKAP
jgi:hypothetical protein